MAKDFKRKSDPFIKVSLLRSNLNLMVEMGKIDQETIDKIINWLSLDYIEKEWNKPPLAERMLRDFVAFMEDYQVHFYLAGGQPLNIYWNDWGESLHIHAAPSMFDVKYAKTLKKLYKEKKAFNREVERKGRNMTLDEARYKLYCIENSRYPGRGMTHDEKLGVAIENEYKLISECKDEKEKLRHQQLAEFLEELNLTQEKLRVRNAIQKAMNANKVAPFIFHDFQQWLAIKYPNMIIYLESLRKAKQEYMKEVPEFVAFTLSELRDMLEDHGWDIRI